MSVNMIKGVDLSAQSKIESYLQTRTQTGANLEWYIHENGRNIRWRSSLKINIELT